MKISKTSILIFILALAGYLGVDYMIDGKVKNLIKLTSQLSETVQKESIELRRINTQVAEKQRELDNLKNEMSGVMGELNKLKAAPETVIK